MKNDKEGGKFFTFSIFIRFSFFSFFSAAKLLKTSGMAKYFV